MSGRHDKAPPIVAGLTDALIAKSEISRYYADRLAKHKAERARVLADLDAKIALFEAADTAWRERGEITSTLRGGGAEPDAVARDLRIEIDFIIGDAQFRYFKAAQPAIDNPRDGGYVAAAHAAGEREKALRRWLTAEGYDLGVLAEPPPKTGHGKGRR